MSDTYSSVDGARSIERALEWQDRIDGWPQVQAYKRRSFELLAGLAPVLDVGAGTGLDAIALDALGVDASAAMCARASGRGAVVARADAHALPFPSDSFGGVRADRVVQHLADPVAALDELVRVTRPGGRVAVCDPDQESLVIAVPGVRPELVAEVKRMRRDVGYRNGTLAGRLPSLLSARGLGDVTVDAFPLVLTDPDDAFGLPGWVRYWQERAPFDARDVAEWEQGVERSRRDGGFVYALLYLVVSGRVAG